jgi:membrane protein YdbS with pleckstrin-like domain
MEQNQDFKQELQQDLREMQHQVERHSRFNGEVWRRTVKRHTGWLYYTNLISSIILLLLIIVVTTLSWALDLWPWWLILPVDLLMIYTVVYWFITSRGMYRPDVHSKAGLLSLRESVKKSSANTSPHVWIIRVLAGVIIVLLLAYAYKHGSDFFSTKLIGGAAGLFVGLLVAKIMKGHYKNLSEEIDELLKEE